MKTLKAMYEDAKRKAEKIEKKVLKTANNAIEYLGENPEVAAVVIPAAIYGGTRLVSNVQTRNRIRERNVDVERRIYDPQEGHYWYTNRKLTNRDFEDISRLRRAGFTREQALRYLGVLR